jgi:peptidoglycan/LPS O-acetylase OafA/YrhL
MFDRPEKSLNPNLDLLRAVAVLLVFIGHLAGFCGFMPVRPVNIAVLGDIGVQIFFVHTSLVLMKSLERQQKENPNLYVPFMIRRCFRIYPLAVLCIVTVLFFHLPMGMMSHGHFTGYKPDTQDIIANLSLLPDLSGRTPVLGPAWSLSTELQMYVLLPVLFLTTRSWRRAALAWVAAVAVCYILQLRFQNISLVNFAPCFFAGVLAYRMPNRAILAGKHWPVFVAVVVLAACLIPRASTVQERWSFTVVLALSIPLFAAISNPALVTASKAIAKYSYGIYLTHFFALWVTFEELSRWPFAAKLVAYSALTGALSYVLYHSIEAPMVECGKRMSRLYVTEATSNCAVAKELSIG